MSVFRGRNALFPLGSNPRRPGGSAARRTRNANLGLEMPPERRISLFEPGLDLALNQVRARPAPGFCCTTSRYSSASRTHYVSTRWQTSTIICSRCRKYSCISAWDTTTSPPKSRNPVSECRHLVCMARLRGPNICRRECRMLGRQCTIAASRLAIVVQDAAVTGDPKPVFTGMADLTAQCVGCHAGYRLQ